MTKICGQENYRNKGQTVFNLGKSGLKGAEMILQSTLDDI